MNAADLIRPTTTSNTASSCLRTQMNNTGLEEVDYISGLGTSVRYH
ncbi:MAG: hypothetical protein M3M86_02970 [Thermoproteota archaeon]|nr:hypothetical protein [Thermoproteota archaeon]